MKSLWGLFFAAVFVATGVAPALAADVELSGEVRVRHEDANDADAVTGQRTRLNAKAAVDDKTTAFISLQDARNWGAEAGTTTTGNDDEGVDISQAWLQISNLAGPVGIKMGRQPLAYGDQRLIGGLEWTNNARRFDGIKLGYQSEAVDADLFFTALSADYDEQFNGLYATVKAVPALSALDIYYLQVLKDSTGQDENTIGARAVIKVAGVKVTAEYAAQGGDQSTGTARDGNAMAIAAEYDVTKAFNAGLEYFDGDAGFNNLYPTNHFHYGIADHVGWTNNKGYAVKLAYKVNSDLKLRAQYWDMENQTGSSKRTETNAMVNYKLTEKTGLYVYALSEDVDGAAEKYNKIGVQVAAKF